MKLWKTIRVVDTNLEDTLNILEKSGAHIKEVIPFYFVPYYIHDSSSDLRVTEYKIIYTVEEETNE